MEFIIGKKYEREFKYAFLLISGCAALRKDYWTEGSIEEKGGKLVYDDPVIFVKSGNGSHSYRYDDNVQNAQFADEENNGGGNAQGFTEDGATWFAILRGGGAAISPDANWQNLMFQIAQDYHKQYSVLEYKQQENDEVDVDQAKKIAMAFLKLFHGDFSGEKSPTVLVEPTSGREGKSETQDVYGLSLRLALNGGGGHSEFVIGKIFLERGIDAEMKPMPREEAKKMDELLARFERTNDGNADDEEENLDADAKEAAARRLANLKQSALNGLKDCVPNDQENDFLDYLFMDDPDDVEKVQELLSRTTDSTYELQCDEVKVLCISHLQWKNAAYDVFLDGKRAFRFIFNLNKALTVKCLACPTVKNGKMDYEVLVEKNEMRMQKAADKKAVEPVILKNVNDENFGLTKAELERATEFAAVKTHAKYRYCGVAGVSCKGVIRCDSQMVKSENKFESYCKNCRYPEKVYFDPQGGGNGVEIPAFRIALDVDTTRPVDRNTAKICKNCRRSTLKNLCGVCQLAEKATKGKLEAEQVADATELYKAYAHILPLTWRLPFKKKYCFEDDGLIVFVVGDKKYYYDKLRIESNGILLDAEDEKKRQARLGGKK